MMNLTRRFGRSHAIAGATSRDRSSHRFEIVAVVGQIPGCVPLRHDEHVAARRPGTEVVPPAGDSLSGAARLAELAETLRPEPGILWRAA